MQSDMEKPKYIIGVDPDVEKSGVVFLDVERHRFETVKSMSFPEFIMFINSLHIKCLHDFFKKKT